MKAINITAQIQDKNPDFRAYTLGIKEFSTLPSRFNGSKNITSYYETKTALHEQDGFWEVEKLALGTNQKYGNLQRKGVENKYHYPLIDLTAQEIADAKAEQQEQQAEQSYQTSIDDGRELFARSYRRMYRRFKDPTVAPSNVLTLPDVKKYMRWNESVYTALNSGSFYQAENRILAVLADNAVELSTNNALRRMFEWLRDQIQAYLLTDYDLK